MGEGWGEGFIGKGLGLGDILIVFAVVGRAFSGEDGEGKDHILCPPLGASGLA